MIDLDARTLADITQHAESEAPRECCGLVVIFKGRYIYVRGNNISEDPSNFILDPNDYARAEDMGEPVLIVHSHVGVPPSPSQADLISCEKFRLPWLIVSVPGNAMHMFEPTGYKAPLVGREFSHGILDCYTLIRDYYQEELHIEIPDFHREDDWWKKGQNLYLDNFEKAGFTRVTSPIKENDVLMMQISSDKPNHAGIYIGNDLILHHQHSRLSSKDVYGGWYKKITSHVVRHKEFL